MAFERIQKQAHVVAEHNISVSYDRFTTRFEITHDHTIVFSSLLLFSLYRNTAVVIGGQVFTLKIFWCLLWQSKLVEHHHQQTVVKELLTRRRKKSIGLLIYVMLASSIKLGIGLLT